MIILAIGIMTISLLQPQESNDASSESPAPARIVYTTHAPIYIDGNPGFLGPNASTGINWGSGTASDPYIIEDWYINASSANGIEIRNSDVHFIIRNCYIHDGIGNTHYGISLDSVSNGSMVDNICSNNWFGIYPVSSSNNIVSNNTCYNNGQGIFMRYSGNNIVSNNTCYNNSEGIVIDTLCYNNILSNNNCSNNYDDGIYIDKSSNNTLNNNNCSNGDYGIIITQSSKNNTLSNNIFMNNVEYGVWLYKSNNNTLSNNTCKSNNYYGMFLSTSSNDNTLINNTCSENGYEGIALNGSSSNEIIWNQICNNTRYGIGVWGSSNNEIWNNTFIDNNGAGSIYDPSHIQAYDDVTGNWWNSTDGYGNYWSDWTTPDNVPPWGIVDNTYNISGGAGAKDYYPQTTAPIISEPLIFILAGIMIAIFLIFGNTKKR